MQPDELRELWARQDGELDRCLRFHQERLRANALGGARASVTRHLLVRAAELVVGVLVLLYLGSFLAERVREPRWVLAGGALHVFLVGVVGFTIHQLVLLTRLDYGGPVTVLQRSLERVALAEYRAFKWALLGGTLLWALVPMVLLEAAFGLDLFERLPLPWVLGNVAFGVVFLLGAQVWSRRYIEDPAARPWARRLVRSLSGRGVRAARTHLEELAHFEHESV